MATFGRMDSESFWQKYGTRTMAFVIGIGLLVVLLIAAMGSCTTTITNTQVAVVVNNLTGNTSRVEAGGMIFHLPFGLTSVYEIDKSLRVMPLTSAVRNKEHPAGAQVNIKTKDGSNVQVDIEVMYQLTAAEAERVYRELGNEDDIDDILVALTRSEIRDQLGKLATNDISDPAVRTEYMKKAEVSLREKLDPIGIEIVALAAKNFHFDEKYDTLIRERKETDQILTNQHDYQVQARQEGNRRKAEAERELQTELRQLDAELGKQEIAAKGDATRIVTKVRQQAYQLEIEGETVLKTSEQEATALRAEGSRKAEAMQSLLGAYEHGGEGLVKEALVKFYEGVQIRARPYALSERVEQFQTQAVRAVPAPAQQTTPGK